MIIRKENNYGERQLFLFFSFSFTAKLLSLQRNCAIAIIRMTMLTACTNNDNPDIPQPVVEKAVRVLHITSDADGST